MASVFDAEIAKPAGDRNVGLIDTGNPRQPWSRGQLLFEFVHCVAIALSDHFYSPVRKIAHGAEHLMSRGRTQGEIPIAHTLNFTVDKKSSRDQVDH